MAHQLRQSTMISEKSNNLNMANFTLIVSPPFGEKDFISNYFSSRGFSDFTSLQIYDNLFYIASKTQQRVEAFLDKFDNAKINNHNLRVYMKDHSRRLNSRTIQIDFYPEDLLTDRNIWNDFYKTGFIRFIEVRGKVAYIQYDTESDAFKACSQMDHYLIDAKYPIMVRLIPDRIFGNPEVGIPLVFEKDPQMNTQRWDLEQSKTSYIRPKSLIQETSSSTNFK